MKTTLSFLLFSLRLTPCASETRNFNQCTLMEAAHNPLLCAENASSRRPTFFLNLTDLLLPNLGQDEN